MCVVYIYIVWQLTGALCHCNAHAEAAAADVVWKPDKAVRAERSVEKRKRGKYSRERGGVKADGIQYRL